MPPPNPVVTPQPSKASCSSGSEVATGTRDASSTTMTSAKVPHPQTAGAIWPDPTRYRRAAFTFGPNSQWLDISFMHHQQMPQAGDTDAKLDPDFHPSHL